MLRVGVLDGIVFVLSCTIGSGLFFAPAITAKAVQNPYLAIAAWVLAGAISMAGSLVYAELGTSLISSGAESHYLNKAFGPTMSFMFAWTLTTIIGSTACAVIARVMGSYIWAIFHDTDSHLFVNLSSILIMVVLCCINLTKPSYVLMLNRFNVCCKALAVLTVVLGGLYVIAMGQISSDAFVFGSPSSHDWTGFGTAVMAAAFALGGWNFLNPLAENMTDPERNIPKVYLTGLSLTIVLAIAVNLAFYIVLPLGVFQSSSSSLAGPFAAQLLPGLRPVLCTLIAFCCFGACNGIMMGTVQCIQGNGRDRVLPAILAYETDLHHIPVVAVTFFSAWTCAQLLLLSLNPVAAINIAVTIYTVGQWSVFVVVGVSLFVLRYRYPNLPRPYKIHFYPVLPSLFVLFSIAVTIVTFKDWLPSMIALCVILLGAFVYYASRFEPVRKAYVALTSFVPNVAPKTSIEMSTHKVTNAA